MSTPIKYNSLLRPATDPRQPGDIVLRRMVAKNDAYEEFVIRPINGATLSFTADGTLTGGYSVQDASPLTGATVVMNDDAVDTTLNITPAGTIAALTVTLPTEAKSRIGQFVRITTSQIVTSLTVNGATTIRGNVTTLASVGSSVTFQKIAANTWARLA